MSGFDQMIENLAARMGVSSKQLQAALQTNNPQAVASLLQGKQAAAFQKVISNPEAVKQLLNSKQAKNLENSLQKNQK